jgi:pyridoxine 5'-phosphate synthase PdxJ
MERGGFTRVMASNTSTEKTFCAKTVRRVIKSIVRSAKQVGGAVSIFVSEDIQSALEKMEIVQTPGLVEVWTEVDGAFSMLGYL